MFFIPDGQQSLSLLYLELLLVQLKYRNPEIGSADGFWIFLFILSLFPFYLMWYRSS